MASDHFENANVFNFIFDHFDDYAITENEHSVEENSTRIQIENDGINTSHSFDTLLDNIGENELIFNEDVTKKDVYEVTSSLVTVPPSLFKRNHFRLEDLHTSNRFLRKPLSSLSSTYYNTKDSIPPIVLQCPKEARTKYLLRFPKMYQEFMNSSNIEKLKALIYDTFTQDFVYHILTSPPMMGIENIYEMQCQTLLSSPDFYVSIGDIKYFNRRTITCLGTSFGTVPYIATEPQPNKRTSFWNFLGLSPQMLDVFHQIQKQKYDLLISQKKTIRFKRKTRWYLFLNKESSKFKKGMALFATLEILEDSDCALTELPSCAEDQLEVPVNHVIKGAYLKSEN